MKKPPVGRAEANFLAGKIGVPNNPVNAPDRPMNDMGGGFYSNTYYDGGNVMPPVPYQEVRNPIDPRTRLLEGPPGLMQELQGNAPSQLSVGLPPGKGALAMPRNPILDDPGVAGEGMRDRTGHRVSPLMPAVPDAGQIEGPFSAPSAGGRKAGGQKRKPFNATQAAGNKFQRMLESPENGGYGTMLPGAMPPKPPGAT